ncbi:Uncharacterised protein [Yersinia enterocolitica]|nr:Uncharacterised protein [Yersinia enterocolitica]
MVGCAHYGYVTRELPGVAVAQIDVLALDMGCIGPIYPDHPLSDQY